MKEEKIYTLEELESTMNENWKIFCANYITKWRKARSYMAAYPESSYGAAAVSANELLKNPKIKAYIDFIKDDIAKQAGISKLDIIMRLDRLSRSVDEKDTKIDVAPKEQISASDSILKAMDWNGSNKVELSNPDGTLKPTVLSLSYGDMHEEEKDDE